MDSHINANAGAGRNAGCPPDLPPPLPSQVHAASTPAPPPGTASAQRSGSDAPLLDFGEGSFKGGTAAKRRAAEPANADDDADDGADLAASPLVQSLVLWGIVSLLFSILAIWVNTAPMVLRAGFFMKVLSIVLGTCMGAGGAVIGDALRKFTRPDAFFTSGGMGQILWLKLFWMCGPQVIGMLIGSLLGISIVLH